LLATDQSGLVKPDQMMLIGYMSKISLMLLHNVKAEEVETSSFRYWQIQSLV
jgi:hypothetical protein